jgi:ribosomal protein L7Ae-like RNA K-turn-binding protein
LSTPLNLVKKLEDLCKENGIKVSSLTGRQDAPSLAKLPAAKYHAAKAWLASAIEYKSKGAA